MGGCARKSECHKAVAVGPADRESRESHREAVLRVIVPLLTALPKARLTALI
jgi:hypothetical protein